MKLNIPLVSIVIPNFNYAHFLVERFESILNQTFKDFEIIFLDDASCDDSVSLVREKYYQHIIHFEVNKENSGNPFIQWNRGVRFARGKYVWIAEADDTCSLNFLERMVKVMEANNSVGLAYCNTTPIDDNGLVIDKDFYTTYTSDLDTKRWLSDFQSNGLLEVRNYLARKNTITNVSGVLFRRESFISANYAPENLRMCGDWLTYCRVLHESNLAFISSPLNFHRQHTAKHTKNSVLDLTYFRELLYVQDYVARAFSFSSKERLAAFNQFLGEWDRLTISNYGRIGLFQTLLLAKMSAIAFKTPKCLARTAYHLFLNSYKSLKGR
jgi:glycosyltransferase involved in cell wall biosynthesis